MILNWVKVTDNATYPQHSNSSLVQGMNGKISRWIIFAVYAPKRYHIRIESKHRCFSQQHQSVTRIVEAPKMEIANRCEFFCQAEFQTSEAERLIIS